MVFPVSQIIARILRSRVGLAILTVVVMAGFIMLHIAMGPVRARGEADKNIRRAIEFYVEVERTATEAPVPAYLAELSDHWKLAVLPLKLRETASRRLVARADSARAAAGRAIERKALAWIRKDAHDSALGPRDIAALLPPAAGLPGLPRDSSSAASDEVISDLCRLVLDEVRDVTHPGTDAHRLLYARDLLRSIQSAVPRALAVEHDRLWRDVSSRLDVVNGESPSPEYVSARLLERRAYLRRIQSHFAAAGIDASLRLVGDDFAVLEIRADRDADRASITQLVSRRVMIEILRDLGFRALRAEGVDLPLFGSDS